MINITPSAASTTAPIPANTVLVKHNSARSAKTMGVGLNVLPPELPPASLCAALRAPGDRAGLRPLLVNGVGGDILAHTAPKKNKEASADHRPKATAASHA
jgi:hypothetical protein